MPDSKPTSRKQKILITLIIVTVGLLIVSFLAGSGEGQPAGADIDQSECLQQGDVWDNTNQRCYSSTATHFPQSYLADCNGMTENVQFNILRDGRSQVIFSGSPAQAYQLDRSGSSAVGRVYSGSGVTAVYDQSSARLMLERQNQSYNLNCSLRANRPETPPGTQATRLKLDETSTANGVAITLNDIITDSRCPVDAVCVRDGQFTVNATLETNDLLEQPNLSFKDSGYMFANRRVAVVGVLPPRTSTSEIKGDDYLVTLWVTEAE